MNTNTTTQRENDKGQTMSEKLVLVETIWNNGKGIDILRKGADFGFRNAMYRSDISENTIFFGNTSRDMALANAQYYGMISNAINWGK